MAHQLSNAPVEPTESIGAALQRVGNTTPLATALLSPGREPTDCASLSSQISSTAAQLRSIGLHANSAVAVVLPGGPELAACIVSVAAATRCAPIDPRATAEEIEFVLRDIAAAAIIMSEHIHPAAARAAASAGCAVIELEPRGSAGRFVLRRNGSEIPALDENLHSGAAATAASTALLLHTSGTTARPKLVGLSHRQLLLSARAVAQSLRLTPADRSLVVMPLFHVHGIVAALLAPLLSGGEVIVPAALTSADLADLVETTQPTWITAVPTLLAALLEQCEVRPVEHRLRMIRSCSAALAQSVADGLERCLAVPVVQAYGMTEGAHQIASNPLPPAARSAASVGFSTGPEIAIVDEVGAAVPRGSVGEVVLFGPSMITSYVDNPLADATAFRDGWFRTGDLGRIDVDGSLYLVGRIKELVNRAGEKIAPREVEEILLAHPAVSDAIVFAVPDRRLGEQVAAAVVRRSDVSEQQLRIFVAEHLAPFKVPRRIVFCDEIPKGPTGKPQRRLLAERLDLAELDDVNDAAGVTPSRPPEGPVEELLADWWARVLRREIDNVHARFLDVGGDSLGAMRLLALIRTELEITISIIELFDAPTIAAQAALIEDRLLDD